MTGSQRRAIESIARRAGLDPDKEANTLHGVDFNGLTIRQASERIDHLKDRAPAANCHSVRRNKKPRSSKRIQSRKTSIRGCFGTNPKAYLRTNRSTKWWPKRIQMVDIQVPITDVHTQLLRRHTEPEASPQMLLEKLNLKVARSATAPNQHRRNRAVTQQNGVIL